MNTCPVYRRSGGLSYGATYSGPIGIILDPTMDRHRYSTLPFSSTLNGSCTNVCPVKINIHEQIFAWRKVMAEEHRLSMPKAALMKLLGKVLAHPTLYRAAVSTADEVLRVLPHHVAASRFNAWTQKGRDMPEVPKQTFHTWWYQNRVREADKS
jgi:L-lactate dehydrogenase complex protein LldF